MPLGLNAVENSSMIAADGYDPDTQTLTIKFTNADIWRYGGVDPKTADEYDRADSKGKFFLRVIKPNVLGVKVN